MPHSITPALAEAEVLALGLGDVDLRLPDEAPQLGVDVTLECPHSSTAPTLGRHKAIKIDNKETMKPPHFCCFIHANDNDRTLHS